MRDPVIYRIRFAHHYRTGDTWCIYPMYDYTHCVSDALENITHSLCTLEFEDHRPLYDWFLAQLADDGVFTRPLPQQIEFSRLNLTYAITSKRKLLQLVKENHVDGWDDPRMPTIVGVRRRGFTPESIRLMADRIGVTKVDSWIDMSVLEGALRDDLDAKAPRAIAVLDPLKLIIDNYPEGTERGVQRAGASAASGARHARVPVLARTVDRARGLPGNAAEGLFPPVPGQQGAPEVRLRRGMHGRGQGRERQRDRRPLQILPRQQVRHGRREQLQGQGHDPLGQRGDAYAAEVRLYDRLFKEPQPGAGGAEFLDALNPDSKRVVNAYLEPSARDAAAEDRFQFERHGYFVADRVDSQPGKPVFNRIVSLRDSWGKPA